ncbi:MAG: hypothetical protein KGS61_01010 [Verrucomicrobia bacterium]|nr:hypothetical protein [Verrucomicrobiota bacterium]
MRTPRGLTVLGMFRRLVISFACAWLDGPSNLKRRLSTRYFQRHLAFDRARLGFALVTARKPNAWKDR